MKLYFNYTKRYWYILPTIEIDIRFKMVNFGWLCLNFSIDWAPTENFLT